MTEIYVKLRKFFDVNKTGATNIYLGKRTWMKIQDEPTAKENIQMYAERRTTFLGLNVYIVDSEEHVELS
jgi:hypothetical protein